MKISTGIVSNSENRKCRHPRRFPMEIAPISAIDHAGQEVSDYPITVEPEEPHFKRRPRLLAKDSRFRDAFGEIRN